MSEDLAAYRIFDRCLKSAFELPSLPSTTADLRSIQFAVTPDAACGEGELIHSFEDSHGDVTLQVFQSGDAFRLYLPDGGNFKVSADLSNVVCVPDPDVTADTIEHLLLDQVIPRILAQEGCLVFHGSCVRLASGKVVGFLGDSGAGKSTIAASVLASGGELLTDDSFMVTIESGEPMTIPSYAGLRLWPDMTDDLLPNHERSPMAHYSEKERVIVTSHDRETFAYPLAALFLINPVSSDDSPSNLAMKLLSATFALNVQDPACHKSWLSVIEQLMQSGVSIELLNYEHSQDGLAAVLARLSQLP